MIIAIIQARMGSSRLPGKILMEVDYVPMIKYQIDRVKKAKMIDKIIIATTDNPKDNAVEDFCKQNSIDCYRGSENDVLDRYYTTAVKYQAKTIVRLTADCPFSDPEVIDKTIELFKQSDVDYACNTVPPETSKFPDGSDVEIFSFDALERAWQEAADINDREHVTFYFWKGNHGFTTAQLENEFNWGKYRLTLDYPEDLEVISFIIYELKKQKKFGTLKEIIEILDSNVEIRNKNSKYYFGIGWGKK